MNKKLSLICCCHNHGHMLDGMLDGVFSQTLSPDKWKLLILFDACTDGSKETFLDSWSKLCKEFGFTLSWLEYIILEKDEKKGLANAKNFVLNHEKCDTEYIAYIDADDGMFPQRLEKQLEIMENNSVIDICACQAWDRYGEGRLHINCFYKGQYENHVQIEQALQHENVICHGSVMAKRQALLDVGCYSESRRVLGREDWDLWQRCLSADKKFYNYPERLYIYSMGTSVER